MIDDGKLGWLRRRLLYKELSIAPYPTLFNSVDYRISFKSYVDRSIDIFTEKVHECDFLHQESFDYMAKVYTGGLTWPTDLLVCISVQCIITFNFQVHCFAETRQVV